MNLNVTDTALLKNRDWAAIDGQMCLVTEFVPMAKMSNGEITAIDSQLPYASVTLRTEDGREVKGFVTHKTDFAMLWAAFNERTRVPGTRVDVASDVESPDDLGLDRLGENEEVWLVWTQKHYRTGAGLLRPFLPKLIVMVSRKGSMELLRNNEMRPDLQGMPRHLATRPLITWTPEVMNL